ncbi:TPA: ATP-binding protein [Candidatus Ventrenecus avicola]|nr:ATP-binding protein [Candidatus Ventrenecus avicola]
MKRLFWKKIVNWYEKGMEKPLIVIGPRHIGKTYLINEFCKTYFQNILYLNLETEKEVIQTFKKIHLFQDKIKYLEAKFNAKLDNPDTVLFIDELHESKEFMNVLPLFANSQKHYKIICASSVLESTITEKEFESLKEKVDIKEMYPMSFSEFLAATGNTKFIEMIQQCFINNKPMLKQFHEILLNLFHQFLYLGGMPENIKSFIQNEKDFVLMDQNIITKVTEDYLSDMQNMNKRNETDRIIKIYKSIPRQLMKANQKFMFTKIDTVDNRKRDYLPALNKLLQSKLASISYEVPEPQTPLTENSNREKFKLYINDTGLLCQLTDTKNYEIMYENTYPHQDILLETYVANELTKLKLPLYYWTRKGEKKGNSELDFLIQINTQIIPVEVKADNKTRSKSLSVYESDYEPTYSLRISEKNFSYKQNIKTIPFYAVFCLPLLKEKEELKRRQKSKINV